MIEEFFKILIVVVIITVMITIFFNLVKSWKENESQAKVFKSFESLANLVNNLCFSYPGNERIEKIFINEKTIAIFASNEYKEYDENLLKQKVKNSELSFGNFICLKYKDKRIKCIELACNLNMSYIGYKEEVRYFFSLWIKEAEVKVKVRKEENFVNIV